MFAGSFLWFSWFVITLQEPEALCNKRYPSETHLKPKSRQISFTHNLFTSKQIVWNFAQSTVVVLPCSMQKNRNDWTIEAGVKTDDISRDLRYAFRMDTLYHTGSLLTWIKMADEISPDLTAIPVLVFCGMFSVRLSIWPGVLFTRHPTHISVPLC